MLLLTAEVRCTCPCATVAEVYQTMHQQLRHAVKSLKHSGSKSKAEHDALNDKNAEKACLALVWRGLIAHIRLCQL